MTSAIIDAVLQWYQLIFAYPDTESAWRRPAVAAANDLLGSAGYDAVISTSPLPTMHLVAAELKRRHGLFWVADFRDPWTRNPNYPHGRLRRIVEERLERQILSAADVMTAASPGYARRQGDLHGRPAHVVPVGFDPETLNHPPRPLTGHFTITYTGSIYPSRQDPEHVLVAIRRLIDRQAVDPATLEVRFYGRQTAGLRRMVRRLGLIGAVTLHGTVSREEAIQRQQESQILLLLDWKGSSEVGVYPLKLFEYLAAQRPIILAGGRPAADVKRLLEETRAGLSAVTPDAVEQAILFYYKQYRQNGQVVFQGNAPAINQYAYPEITRRFADLLAARRPPGAGDADVQV